MDKNKEIRALSQDEVEKISGGYLSNEEVKEFFPNNDCVEYYKISYAPEVCQRCGKRFARYVRTENELSLYGLVRQEYCEECADKLTKGKPCFGR